MSRLSSLPRLGRATAASLAAAAVAGCNSVPLPHQEYDAPRVTGRVIDARTHQPVAGATIRRGPPVVEIPGTGMEDRGTLREGPPTVTSDRQGRFELDSIRGFYLLDRNDGYSTTISVTRSGYQPFETNYTMVRYVTDTPRGEPRVDAGDLPLEPSSPSGE